MLSITLAALLVATWAAIVVAWLKRMRTAQFCPACATNTQAVVAPFWLRPVARWLVVRWCPQCRWQGVGRNGPHFIRGRKLSHDSGFHWGTDEVGENAGFEWRKVEVLPPMAEPPAHRSGFRFGANPGQEQAQPKNKAHRSGFAWGGVAEPHPAFERRQEDQQSGFSWGNRRTDLAGPKPKTDERGLGRKDSPKPGKSDAGGSSGFKWGGVA
jgi:hypothetical protein